MKFIPPAIFALALTIALIVIWKTVRQALPTIRKLRSELRGVAAPMLAPIGEPAQAPIAMRQGTAHRPRRRLQPKPVTHRLHHFTVEISTRHRIPGSA